MAIYEIYMINRWAGCMWRHKMKTSKLLNSLILCWIFPKLSTICLFHYSAFIKINLSSWWTLPLKGVSLRIWVKHKCMVDRLSGEAAPPPRINLHAHAHSHAHMHAHTTQTYRLTQTYGLIHTHTHYSYAQHILHIHMTLMSC